MYQRIYEVIPGLIRQFECICHQTYLVTYAVASKTCQADASWLDSSNCFAYK